MEQISYCDKQAHSIFRRAFVFVSWSDIFAIYLYLFQWHHHANVANLSVYAYCKFHLHVVQTGPGKLIPALFCIQYITEIPGIGKPIPGTARKNENESILALYIHVTVLIWYQVQTDANLFQIKVYWTFVPGKLCHQTFPKYSLIKIALMFSLKFNST